MMYLTNKTQKQKESWRANGQTKKFRWKRIYYDIQRSVRTRCHTKSQVFKLENKSLKFFFASINLNKLDSLMLNVTATVKMNEIKAEK